MVLLYEKILAMIIVGDRQKSLKKPDNRIFLRINFSFLLKKHPDPGKNKESSEDYDYPVETVYKSHSGKDENGTHNKCPDYPPEQYPVLVLSFNGKIREDENEDKNIIYTKRVFNDISSQIFESQSLSKLVINKNVEKERKCYPDSTPDKGFLNRDLMRFLVKYSKVKGQHKKNEDVKTDPKINADPHVI